MCGIFACMGVVDAGKTIYQGLKNLEYRGYDSWGIALPSDSDITVTKGVGFLPPKPPRLTLAKSGIGHTRWATHGGVTVSNAHPHLDCTKNIAVVHNGIVNNWLELKSKLDSHTFSSQTDTEVLAHFIEDKLEHGQSLLESVQELISNISGYNAFVVYDAQSSTIIAYRNGSPLTLAKHEDKIYLSSDLPTLRPLAKQIYPLKDNELVIINSSSCQLIRNNKKVTVPWQESTATVSKTKKIKTKYHMESEILECISLLPKGSLDIKKQTRVIKHSITKARSIILVGCGSAYYASRLGELIFQEHGYAASAVIASDGNSSLQTINKETLVIATSQSGETIDTLEYVRSCKKKGATIAAIVNVPDSTLDQEADHSIYLNTGVEVAVASTKAFFYMLLTFLTFFPDPNFASLANSLFASLSTLNSVKSRNSLRILARQISELEHVFILGKGHLYPIALELALKLKEIGYLHAEAVPSGELKHGPLALITKGSLCLILSDSATRADLDNTASEIKARGGEVVMLDSPELGVMTPLHHTTLTHLISFELSLIRGINPDRPRNLAKSVTVK